MKYLDALLDGNLNVPVSLHRQNRQNRPLSDKQPVETHESSEVSTGKTGKTNEPTTSTSSLLVTPALVEFPDLQLSDDSLWRAGHFIVATRGTLPAYRKFWNEKHKTNKGEA